MTESELKNVYGAEYPAVIRWEGIRVPLTRQRRFSRVYQSADKEVGTVILSRFMDGSAGITLAELQNEWDDCSEHERLDFCQQCGWLHKQADFADMLRFIVAGACPSELSAIAGQIAVHLPLNESFAILIRSLHTAETGKTSNILQGIALTKHCEALAALREHFNKIWRHPQLKADQKFLNWVAYDATNCIQYMLELGASPDEFAENVRQLSKHPCQRNREACHRWLAKYYSWLA